MISSDQPLVVGTRIEQGLNVYEVVDPGDRLVQLRCVYFVSEEDMGDRIFCTYLNQEIWMAKFHLPSYSISNYVPE